MIDQLNSIRALSGALLLDVGASPHGYALERALEHGATVYLGMGKKNGGTKTPQLAVEASAGSSG